jgi:hypothetical protein
MKKIPLTIALVGALATGCANFIVQKSDSEDNGACRDEIKVIHASGKLVVNRPIANVCSGTTVTVRVLPPNRPVFLRRKDRSTDWPNSSTEGGDIVLTVPSADDSRDYPLVVEYEIEVRNVGMLDPTFRIIR